MRLQVKVSGRLICIVDEDLIHRHIIGAQMFGAVKDLHLRKMFAQAIHNWLRISINHDLRNLRGGEQGFDDMLEQWLAPPAHDNSCQAHAGYDDAWERGQRFLS